MGLDKKYVEKNPLIWPETVENRLYQQTIAEKACQKNTMVILPTALGKTVISALVAAYFLYNHWDMKILVMAPTRPLVKQHMDYMKRSLKVPKQTFVWLTGEVPPPERASLWREKQIFFATPQVVLNDLLSGRLSLEDLDVVVFDDIGGKKPDDIPAGRSGQDLPLLQRLENLVSPRMYASVFCCYLSRSHKITYN